MDDQKNILKIENVSKSFGFVKALSDVSFSVRSGEIHALLGENGAGKSTLIKILAGDLIPDEGSVCIDGTKVETYHPTIARNLGISVVHQELSIFENMLVYENIFPYNSDSQFVIPKKELIRRAADAIERFRLPLSPTARVGDLRLSVQQMVEILRALSDNAKIILLDEPTSGLNENEAALLKGILTSLRAEGITIIYISHRISEIMGLCDRITVLRDGQYITTLENNDELTESALVSRMVGREFLGSIYSKKVSRLRSDAEPVLEAKGFSNNATVMDASVSLHHQELLGVFGLEGSGTHEFSRMLFGLQEKNAGELTAFGEKIATITPGQMIDRKILFLNNNRKEAGLFFNMTIADNLAAPVLSELTNSKLISRQKVLEHARFFVSQFNIVLSSLNAVPLSLSGGNQQKVMLSTALGAQPKIMIINEPTRGIDVGTKQEIIKFIENLTKQDVSIICFSSELPELITMCDRIAVMNTGRIVGVLEGESISESNVMKLATMDLKPHEESKVTYATT